MRTVSTYIALLFLSVSQDVRSAETERMAKQFLNSHCIRCHGEEKQKGKIALHKLSVDFAKPGVSELWLKVLEQLTARDMPPPDEAKRPSDSEQNAMIEWVDRRLLTAGSGES